LKNKKSIFTLPLAAVFFGSVRRKNAKSRAFFLSVVEIENWVAQVDRNPSFSLRLEKLREWLPRLKVLGDIV